MKQHQQECFNAGMTGYLSKPIQRECLQHSIENALMHVAKPNQNKGHHPAPEDTGVPSLQSMTPHLQESGSGQESLLIDKKALLKRFSDDESLISEILGIFVKDIPQQLENLKQALHNNDPVSVQKAGHRINGSSANVQALTMEKLAFDIEKSGQNAQLEDVMPLVVKLESEFHKLRSFLS